MLDKFLAIVAIVSLIVFVSILLVFVKSPSLTIVIVIGVVFASFDFLRTTFFKKNGNSKKT